MIRLIYLAATMMLASQPVLAKSTAAAGSYVPLIEAVRSGDLNRVRTVLSSAENSAATDSLGRTALHYAAALGLNEILEALLAADTPPLNVQDPDGFSPLMRAAQNGHLDAARLLLASGADTSLENQNGLTAKDLAEGKSGIEALFE